MKVTDFHEQNLQAVKKGLVIFMKLFMLAKSSLKKNRSSAITLFFLIVMATVFLYVGLIVLFNLDGFLDQKNAEINGADYVAIVPRALEEKVESILTRMEDIRTLESEDAVVYSSAQLQNDRLGEKAQSIGLIFLNSDTTRTMSEMTVIDEKGSMGKNSIVVPYYLKTAFGYEAGDEIEITFSDKTDTYIVYGFSEDVIFSTATNLSYYKCFVPNENFNELYQSVSEPSRGAYFKALIKDGLSTEEFDGMFTKLASQDQTFDSSMIQGLNYDTMKEGTKATINIIMTVLVFFAVLILVISMVVIRYTIITHIEEDIKNIGSMEAAGFTNAMIRGALILQFLFLGIFGYLVGILISLSCSELVTNVISSSIGLNWNIQVSPTTMLITIAIILLLLLVITIKVTKRVAKITPIMALRSGIGTFHFGKNHFPLGTSHGNVNLLLGFKQIFNNKKQSISISIIGILMSFTLVFAFSIYYNFVLDEDAFLNIIGIEKPDIAMLYLPEPYEEVFQKASALEGVKKSVHYTQNNLTLIREEKEISTAVFISDNFSSNEVSTIIEGRYPQHDNEIVLSTVIRKILKADIGDIVSIKSGTDQYDYLVVGISQHINHLGQSASLTEEGMKRTNPAFHPTTLYLYLEDNYEIEKAMDELSEVLVDYDTTIINMNDTFKTMLSSITQSITMICIVIGIITALIIVLILYYLVKVKILREKITLGVYKALGFTTGQLVLHNNITLCSIIFISTLIGSALAVVLINPLCAMLLSISGIQSCSFVIPPVLIIITIAIMTVLTMITTTLVSLRIRNLNPRELIAD